MGKLIFVSWVTSGAAEQGTLLLTRSIRKFGGALADKPIWVFVPGQVDILSESVRDEFASLNVRLIPFAIDPDVRKFPLAVLPVVTAAAEATTQGQAEILAWLDINTILLREPSEFLLAPGKSLGYRPVQHTLIGSVYDQPIDSFWESIYKHCHVPVDRLFPMPTCTGDNVLRPYFNAGFLVVRPEKGLLRAWLDNFLRLYRQPYFEEFYAKDERYSIFIHQAVLTGTILARLETPELQELSPAVNYPIDLHRECRADLRPQSMNELITCRYEDFPEILKRGLPAQGELGDWLARQLRGFEQRP